MLENYEINLETEIENEKILLEYQGAQLFSINAISCIVGYAKSRKSFLKDLFISKMFSNDENFKGDFTGKALVIDTEQNKSWCKKSFIRLNNMGVDTERLKLYAVKDMGIHERIDFIEKAIIANEPEIVFLDGIRDIVADFNDLKEVTAVIQKIMSWVVKYSIHFNTILHLNPGSDKPKGHLGTELLCKCDSVIGVTTRRQSSEVKPIVMRDKDFEKFKFEINEGIPVI